MTPKCCAKYSLFKIVSLLCMFYILFLSLLHYA